MSAHPFGPDGCTDAAGLYAFSRAVSDYASARASAQIYETSKVENPEAFTVTDMAELEARRAEQCEAANAVLAQAMILKGTGVLIRSINALGGRI